MAQYFYLRSGEVPAMWYKQTWAFAIRKDQFVIFPTIRIKLKQKTDVQFGTFMPLLNPTARDCGIHFMWLWFVIGTRFSKKQG